jgi:alpha-beta hydrolase superfamily lysophospholipase
MIETAVPRDPAGVVLVVHGGASRPGSPEVRPTQLSVLRMVPVARRVARAGRGRLAVVRLLNSVRGWDSRHSPVDDVRWALGELASRFGDLPTGLVGHSLGGRAVLLAGDAPGVRSVVALNPWLYPTDTPRLAGRTVLVVHGSADRVASPARSEAVARRVAADTDVSYVCVDGGKHAMLRRGRVFDGLAADATAAALLGPVATQPSQRWRTV